MAQSGSDGASPSRNHAKLFRQEWLRNGCFGLQSQKLSRAWHRFSVCATPIRSDSSAVCPIKSAPPQSFTHGLCAVLENDGVAQNGPKSCHFVPLFLAKLTLHLAWQWPKTSARPVSPIGMVEKEDTVHGVVDARRGLIVVFRCAKGDYDRWCSFRPCIISRSWRVPAARSPDKRLART
jgi:hypothetical protein